MTVWVLTFFMFTYPPEGGSRTTVFSGAYRTREACLLDAEGRSIEVRMQNPNSSVQLGSSPCNPKELLG